MSKYSKLFSDTLIFGIGNFTTKIIYFFLMPIYTLALSPTDFGLVDLLNNSIQLILPIFTLCISEALFRFCLDEDAVHKELLNNSLRILYISFIPVSVAAAAMYYCSDESYWLLFAVLYVTESLRSLIAQFARGLGYVKQYAVNGVISAVVLLGSTYLFLRVLDWHINGYLTGFIAANIASLAYLLPAVKIHSYISISCFNKSLARAMVLFSLPLVPVTVSWWFNNISSRYILAGFCGLSVAGLFSAASKLPALINVMSSIFQLSWQFASVKEYQQDKNSTFFSTVFEYFSGLILISGSAIVALLPLISQFVLKGSFYDAWQYSPLLIFSAIIGAQTLFLGTFYGVVKNNKRAFYTTLYSTVINILGCLLLIPVTGVWGALIASVTSYLIFLIMRIRDTRRIVPVNVSYPKLITSLTVLLTQCSLMPCEWFHSTPLCILPPLVIAIIYRKNIVRLIVLVASKIKSVFNNRRATGSNSEQ